MEVFMGKSSINGSFSMAMLNNQRVIYVSWSWFFHHHLLQFLQALGWIDAIELSQVQDQTIAQPRVLLFHTLLGLREG